MSARGFRSVFMVASCAGAALGCYLVSLRVASERAALENVETQIVLAHRDIRLLQTEIGTRGRLAQLERWNVKVLALSAPSADQFLDGGFALAKLVAPKDKVDLEAPVVLAAAPADAPQPQLEGAQPRDEQGADAGGSAKQLLHTASLRREPRAAQAGPAAPPRATEAQPAAAPRATSTRGTDKPVPARATDKPATAKATERPAAIAKAPAAKGKAVTAAKSPIARARPESAERSLASDPLAPLGPAAKSRRLASATPRETGNDTGNDTGKDSGSKQ